MKHPIGGTIVDAFSNPFVLSRTCQQSKPKALVGFPSKAAPHTAVQGCTTETLAWKGTKGSPFHGGMVGCEAYVTAAICAARGIFSMRSTLDG